MPWAKNSWRPSLPILAEKGYVIMAVDVHGVDYVSLARQLARSIRCWHPAADISVVTNTDCVDPVFDHVIPLPYGDYGGFANDWQVWYASPYRETIKLEADMIAASPVDHWWTLFRNRDVVISQGARNFYGKHSPCRKYRKTFDINDLPDLYNAITYWRVSETAKEFFQSVRNIFTHWDHYRTLLKFSDDQPTTDVVYAIAAVLMGVERVTLPAMLAPSIVHMKRHINFLQTEDWTKQLISETDPLRINTVAQWGMVHYHIKDWRVL